MTVRLLSKRIDSTLMLTLSNPDARSALDLVVYTASTEALDHAANNNEIRAVVFTGDGNAFCAGDNLNHLLENRSKPRSVQKEGIDALNHWIETTRAFPKPVIAVVEDPAAGAGFSLVPAYDLVIAASDAKSMMTYVNVALTPDGGGSQHITRFLPHPLASEVIMLGKPVSAERLTRFGLIDEVVRPGGALDQAMALMEELAAQPSHAVGRIEDLITHAEDASLHDHLKAEQHSFVGALHHADGNEGISTFLQKRKPQYRQFQARMVPFLTPNHRHVYLMRHGMITYFDETGRPVPSFEAIPLNELGHSQAAAASKIFAAENIVFDRVIVSGLPRTVETAQRVLTEMPATQECNIALEHWPELQEIHGGKLARIPEHELVRTFIGAFENAVSEDRRFLNGESIDEFLGRVIPAITHLRVQTDWDTVLLVLYGGTNHATLSHAITGGECVLSGSLAQTAGCINALDVGEAPTGWVLHMGNFLVPSPTRVGSRLATIEVLLRQCLRRRRPT